MANALGYETLAVGNRAVGPKASIVQGGVMCAIFYLDAEAPSLVRWRPDGGLSGVNNAEPSPGSGLPIYPGGQVVVVGSGNIRNTRFISASGKICQLHCLYFDQVDVLQVDLRGAGPAGQSAEKLLGSVVTQNDEILLELRRIRLGTSIMVDTDLAKESVD